MRADYFGSKKLTVFPISRLESNSGFTLLEILVVTPSTTGPEGQKQLTSMIPCQYRSQQSLKDLRSDYVLVSKWGAKIAILNFKIICMLISSFMAVSARSVHASDNLETLLGLLETRAQSVYTANWTFDTVAMKGVPVYKLPFANDMLRSAHEKGIGNHKIDPLSRVNGDALFDFRKELYKLQFEWRRLQPGSESAIIVEKRVMSFNGEMFVDLVEPNQSNNQSLARVEFDRVYRDVGLRRARLLDSGYFYSPHQLPFIRGISKVDNLTWTLDDFLKECRSNSKVKFSVRSAEHWVVSFPLTWESKDYGIAERG